LKATVADGTVELEGVLDDDRQRWALVVAAENVPGVKGVVDKLVVVEPETGMIIPTP
jgi:osmotically-inducible protein OsmY